MVAAVCASSLLFRGGRLYVIPVRVRTGEPAPCGGDGFVSGRETGRWTRCWQWEGVDSDCWRKVGVVEGGQPLVMR